MPKPSQIKKKIKGTKNIEKVTEAIGKVAFVKMKKFQRIALNSRPFSLAAIDLLKKLIICLNSDYTNLPFSEVPKRAEKILAVVIASDDGFCGNFNASILKFAEKELGNICPSKEKVEIAAIGKKAANYFRRRGYNIKIEYTGMGDHVELDEVLPLSDYLKRQFKTDAYRKIIIFFSEFINTFSYKAQRIQFLPLLKKDFLEDFNIENKRGSVNDYLIEPNSRAVLEALIPFLLDIKFYYAVLQTNTSKYSARMTAMKKATDNAKKILDNLTMIYNKSRQAQITTELSEIIGAAEAIK